MKPDEVSDIFRKAALSVDEFSQANYKLGESLKKISDISLPSLKDGTWHATSEDERFMRDCWYRTLENKDDKKCEHCSYRFQCYTTRENGDEFDDDAVTVSGIGSGTYKMIYPPPLKMPRSLPKKFNFKCPSS